MFAFRRANQGLGFQSLPSGLSGRGIWKILGWVGFCPLRCRELTTGICRVWLGSLRAVVRVRDYDGSLMKRWTGCGKLPGVP